MDAVQDAQGWILYSNEDGYPYWYNVHTGESVWDREEWPDLAALEAVAHGDAAEQRAA